MAITVVRASSQYAEIVSTPLPLSNTVTYSMAAWYKPSSIANGTVLSVGSTASGEYIALGMDATGKVFIEVPPADGFSTGTLTNGAWSHIAGVQASATSRTGYLNGVAGTTNTTTYTPGPFTSTTVGGLMLNGTRTSFSGGDIAECAIWSVALDAGEISALAAGFSPLLIRPASLVFYVPLLGNSPERELIARRQLTYGAAGAAPTIAPHIKVFRPIVTAALPVSSGPAFSSRTGSDSLGTTDSAARAARLLIRSATDSLGTTDVAARPAQVAARAAADNLGTTDSATRAVQTFARTGADTLGTTDSAARAAQAFVRSAADSLGTAEVAGRGAQARSRTASDSLSTTDTATRAPQAPTRAAADSLGTTDAAVRGSVLPARTGSDTLGTSDAVSRAAQAFSRVATDTLGTSDGATRAPQQAARSGTDALGTTDVATRAAMSMARAATDALATFDTATRGVVLASRFGADMLGTTDSATGSQGAVEIEVPVLTVHTGPAGTVVTRHRSANGSLGAGRTGGRGLEVAHD